VLIANDIQRKASLRRRRATRKPRKLVARSQSGTSVISCGNPSAPRPCGTGGSIRTKPSAKNWPADTSGLQSETPTAHGILSMSRCGKCRLVMPSFPSLTPGSLRSASLSHIAGRARSPWSLVRPGSTGRTSAGRLRSASLPCSTKCGPKINIAVLRGVLPARYSPLRPNGNGVQSIYLTEIEPDFAEVLAGLIGPEARPFVSAFQVAAGASGDRMMSGDDLDVWERRLEAKVASDTTIVETDREAIIRARRGQGLFKQRVMQIERRCRITAVDNAIHLLASHCKPWRDSKNEERLDGENGLLLTPKIDHLFDRGFIGFEDSGVLIVSPVAHKPSLPAHGRRDAAHSQRRRVYRRPAEVSRLSSERCIAQGGEIGGSPSRIPRL